jgi:uncharacterized iron-regulated membrane protein
MSLPRAARKAIFWLHLAAGLAAGLVILLLALTGALLAYERQILEWQDGYAPSAPAGEPTLPLEEMAAKVVAGQHGAILTGISREAGAGQPFVFQFGKEKQVFVAHSTGAVLGEGSPRLRKFFGLVTSVHRWLALEGVQREYGKAVTGAAALLFLFLVVSGLVMWWPRRWTWIHLKRILLFQPRLHGPAREWNWHNVVGFWCCVPLLIISLSGVVMSYDWANALVYRVAGSPMPPAKGGPGGNRGSSPTESVSLAGLNRAWRLAESQVQGWQSINLRLPTSDAEPATFTISTSHRGRPDLKSQLMVELGTGHVRAYEAFDDYSRGKQWRFWARWLHTGEAGGFWGQTIAALAAVGAMLLVWTGFALAWRRFRRR